MQICCNKPYNCNMPPLKQLLRDHHLRHTTARQEVFAALQSAERPLFIHQIVNLCPLSNRTSVYRTLNLFATLGIIETITSGWKSRYELAGPFKPHHHHLHCTACHQLIQLDIPILEETIKSFADSHEYMLTGHHIELTGLCKKCQLSLSQGRG